MKRIARLSHLVFSLVLMAAAALPANAGPSKAQLDQIASKLKSLPAEQQRLLSSGLRRVLGLDAALNASHSKVGDQDTVTVPKAGAATALRLATAAAVVGPGPGGTIGVSDPRLDYINSTMSSFTQSETSSAWCGNNIVAGYNDTGAFARTGGVNFFGPWSFSGASFSHDGGRSFTAVSPLNPGTNNDNYIAGDPVLACTSANRFYYASIFAFSSDANGNPFNGVALNISNDAGESWSAPMAAVAKDLSHEIDKPWLAADPTNANRLYVTYTDFDFSGLFGDPTAACPNDIRIAIELAASRNAGATWSAPVVIQQECQFTGGGNGVQGSNVAVGPNGTVYIAYEYFPAAVINDEIRLVRSLEREDGALRLSAPVTVATVWPNGNFGVLQGSFRVNEFPQIAVDRSGGPSRGTLYLTWSDAVANIVPDLPILFDTYAYPDVVFSRSSDGGRTFTAPNRVSPRPSSFTGRGRDQFFPGISVDRRGVVGLCYYDRRERPTNDAIDRYCSTSANRGTTWTERRVSTVNWTATHAADGLLNPAYMGDYDAVSSDFLLQNTGFFSSFEVQTFGNPDVVGATVR
jgi:hypothetical protein